MAGKNFNYAAPGAVVGIQAQNIVISGSISLEDDDMITGTVTSDEDDD